jgi:hypothetical protein
MTKTIGQTLQNFLLRGLGHSFHLLSYVERLA